MSVWLVVAWQTARVRYPTLRLMLAPHEPTAAHLDPIVRWASRNGVSLARLGRDAVGGADLVLVDRVGVLGDLYALADIAYVGGGFHPAGLHSVLEPAAFGAPVLFGPRFEGSRDAALLVQADAGAAVADGDALAAQLIAWLDDDAVRRAAGDRARIVVQNGLGAAERSATLVESLLSHGAATPGAPRG